MKMQFSDLSSTGCHVIQCEKFLPGPGLKHETPGLRADDLTAIQF
jgi:hypothetical protein